MARILDHWHALFAGLGPVPVNQGNRNNAPAPPPVQAGNYEFIQPAMYPDMSITDIPTVPPGYRDWNGYPLDQYGLSGLTGGGSSNDPAVQISGERLFYFDPKLGVYVNIG